MMVSTRILAGAHLTAKHLVANCDNATNADIAKAVGILLTLTLSNLDPDIVQIDTAEERNRLYNSPGALRGDR